MAWTEFILKFIHLFFVEILGVLAWPGVILILGLANREQLRSFLSRLTEIGPTGAKAIPPQIASPLPTAASLAPGQIVPPMPQQDPVLAEIEQNIRDAVTQRGIDKLTQEQQQEFFVREYATLTLASNFERVRLSIFGTQVELLIYLNMQTTPRPKSEFLSFYQKHINRVNDNKQTDRGSFDIWLRYLQDTQLIETTDNETYAISQIGKKFLNDVAIPLNLEATRLF